MRTADGWTEVRPGRAAQVTAGTTARFRAVMRSAVLGSRYQVVRVDVPAASAGAVGYLSFAGGDDSYRSPAEGATVEEMIDVFTDAPRNDEILVRFGFPGMPATRSRLPRDATVAGSIGVSVHAVD